MKDNNKVSGLKGWLILPIIGLFFTIPTMLYDFWELTTLESNPYILLLSLFDIYIIILAMYALILIFDKKKTVPNIMIIIYSSYILMYLITAFLVQDFMFLIFTPIYVIWICYFIFSKRVQNTFVK